MIELPTIKTGKVAIKLKPKAEALVRKGHPWVFDQSITKQNREGNPGDIAVIFDNRKDRFLACGFYDPESPIRIKILQANTPTTIDRAWFKTKIEAAYAKRAPLLETDTNGYRLLYGENDGLPSLVADVYDKVLVVKLYAQIWIPYLNEVLPELIGISQTEVVVLRLSRNVQKAGSPYGLHDGQVLHGTLDDEVIPYREHGVVFSANVIRGHKTGAFLDHRANRKKVGEMAEGKTLLDVFSYAGGFSVHALVRGAAAVTSLDISAQALEVAKQNAALNTYSGTHTILVGDAFKMLDELAREKQLFDVVVIDPPSFAKSKTEVERALHSYEKLAVLGAQLVRKPGILVLASCSSRVSAEQFFALTEKTIGNAVDSYTVLEKTGHDVDHPIGFPEGAYLKCIYFKLNGE